MRCPKCGYISFDRLEKCLNCNKDIGAVSNSLSGAIYNVQAPSFLNLNRVNKEVPSEDLDFSEEQSFSDEEFLDDDLEILEGGDEVDTEEEITFAEDDQISLEPAAEDEEDEDKEIEFDFSQFEDADEQEGVEEVAEPVREEFQETLTLEVPEELSDMSDLAPPAAGKGEDETLKAKPAGTEQSDVDLDELNLDLDLDDLDEEVPSTSKPGVPEEVILALDEIDFSEALAEGSSAKKERNDTDMDEDLNFDLDLGGLSIHDQH